jgi:hypothetical protein
MISARECELKRLMDEVEKREKWLGPHTGTVVKVLDGNTFVLAIDENDPATGRRARLTIIIASLECPEKGESGYDETGYKYNGNGGYKYATGILKAIILGERVKVDISRPIGGWNENRWLADVTYSGGDLARAMKRATYGVCK